MVYVAQLVRALDCGSRGRRFEPGLTPQTTKMEHELRCPKCKCEFVVNDDYESGDCPDCGEMFYYWDYVLDEETFEEHFSGYYWDYYDRKIPS